MESIFIPHPEIPDHYEIKPGFFLITSDCQMKEFKWSRVVRKNYIPSAGFLGHNETIRVDIRAWQQLSEMEPVVHLDHAQIGEDLVRLIPEGREMIFHYRPNGEVQCIVTGVRQDMLSNLSPQYRQYYYEY